jgi:hypothetical protein
VVERFEEAFAQEKDNASISKVGLFHFHYCWHHKRCRAISCQIQELLAQKTLIAVVFLFTRSLMNTFLIENARIYSYPLSQHPISHGHIYKHEICPNTSSLLDHSVRRVIID